jgi:hypothetical protein
MVVKGPKYFRAGQRTPVIMENGFRFPAMERIGPTKSFESTAMYAV